MSYQCEECGDEFRSQESLDQEGICWGCIKRTAMVWYGSDLDETLERFESEFLMMGEKGMTDQDRQAFVHRMLCQYMLEMPGKFSLRVTGGSE